MGVGRRGRLGGKDRLANDPVAQALKDLRQDQAVRRTRVYDLVQIDEIRACKLLAHRIFGDRGVVEFDCHPVSGRRSGPLMIGYFLEGKDPTGPNPRRRRRLIFKGATIAELEEQVRAWRARGGDA